MELIIYVISVAPFTILIYLLFKYYYKISAWSLYDIIFVSIPGLIYFSFKLLNISILIEKSKTLSNLFSELISLALINNIVFLTKSIATKKTPSRNIKYTFIAMLIMCFVTLGVYLFTPPLTE
jgi:hypothetical protein